MNRDRVWSGLSAVVSIGATVLIWELLTRASDSLFLPPPSDVFPHLFSGLGGIGKPPYLSSSASDLFLGDGFYDDVVPSLWRMIRGYVLAVVVGVCGGTMLGLSNTAREYCHFVVNFVRAIPPPALLGVWIVVFGLGDRPKIYLIAFAVVWPILLNTIDGVAAVDEQRKQVAAAFRIPFRRQLTGLYLPSASPKILSGMRIALSFALIMMIISEIAGATNGVGLRLIEDVTFFNIPDLWATMVFLAVIGFIFNGAMSLMEGRLLRWQQEAARSQDA
jgi:ABC-type nitrate/sulfonate/bicarbonate transport system permease component